MAVYQYRFKEVISVAFRSHMVAEGVYQIEDIMGVCMTLLTGTESALLIDTGYGLENVRDYIKSITGLPLRVFLTHGHHDHILGARWFTETCMFALDRDEFILRTGPAQREKVAEQAEGKHIPVDSSFYTETVSLPNALEEGTLDLGGLHAGIIHVPGHTPGSFVVWIPEHRLLLSGDNWNPCTWLWFPSSVGVFEWKQNMEAVMQLPFEHILCSHQYEPQPREKMEQFMQEIHTESIERAERIPLGGSIDTRQIQIADMVFVFDYNKAKLK